MITNDVKDRSGYIGGSDIASVLNLEPYGCARRLWYKKTNTPPDFEFQMSGPMQMGVWAEDGIASMVTERTGWRLIRRSAKQGEPHEGVHIDREIQKARDTPGIAEIKCIGNNSYWTWRKDGVPLGYQLQLQWGMYLWGRKWGAIMAWNRDTGELHIFDFEYNDELMTVVTVKVDEFWDMVEKRTIPSPLDQDDSRCEGCEYRTTCFDAQWADVAGETRMDDLADALARYQTAKEIIKGAEAEADKHRAVIEERMGNNELVQIGAVQVSWKVQNSFRVNTDELKRKYPDVYEESLRRSISRVMRVHKKKEK